MTENEPTITELLAKIDEQNKKIFEMENKNKSLEDDITKFNETINAKDSEITKLQKILATNFVASTEQPKKDEQFVSFSDAYKNMIENNKKR